ncbi:PRD domain-containing protein [Sporolactobacillus sp. THM7-7]|nr:PRD domain-containing protein [Sporolactobacillus sp. THM7-7]
MIMTNREKTILELMTRTSGKHTLLSIATYLQISVRTVRRELKRIEKILEHFDLKLEKDEDHSLQIEGPSESIYKLVQTLAKAKPLDLSEKERKLLALIELLNAREPVKTGPLARDLGISVTTLLAYLDDLQEWIEDFHVRLSRKRGVGVSIEGRESDKRRVLAGFFLFFFNEELIDTIFRLPDIPLEEGTRLLHFFRGKELKLIQESIKEGMEKYDSELADSDYVGFLVSVYITYQRTASGFLLNKDEDSFNEAGVLPFIEHLCQALSEKLSLDLPDFEKAFLSVILKGARPQSEESVYYDRVITGRAVKQLIQHVSKQLNVDLTGDFSLFQGLIAHIEPSLFRIRQAIGVRNPLTEAVKDRYPVLFKITGESLKHVFKDVDFPDDEVAYIVLHFGSAIEQRSVRADLKALVVCPTGIGASKILATRLKKEVPGMSSVHVSSIKDMRLLDLSEFDLILSTVHLPMRNISYIYVNPLLSKADIVEIRSRAAAALKKKTRPSSFSMPVGGRPSPVLKKKQEGPYHLQALMADIDKVKACIGQILQHFSVERVRDVSGVHEAIRLMVDSACLDALIDDRVSVYQKLIAREQLAGLGIPDTDMALYHCRDCSVSGLSFRIACLDRPFLVRGMDGGSVNISNILILLAPDPMTGLQQEVLSTISSSLVEDRESTLIFASGNEAIIRTKLEQIFYQFLKNRFTKD